MGSTEEQTVKASNERSETSGGRDEGDLLERIIAALRTVYDPEISTNIYDLGLIYAIDTVGEHDIAIRMTLTSPGCPVAGILPGQVERAVETVDGVGRCHVELVWDPPWTRDSMSEEAKLELGML